ncbi:hypothetical protein CLV58_109177 [Spirosoma oryzae]|uniref:Uncharacterized protein n=1 Tax=Spirosoma oryzae TaxID=1469603 RepID=A0A2T0SYF9_9BACT|nr:hypothetical protein [Spirosoma oryzae]PRY38450.1 hypothetical protein CLV58_109177 [Spirosoma oryzae]
MSYTFVNADTLIRRVRRVLRSYDETGMIDPVDFPRLLRAGLHDLGLLPGYELETPLALIRGKARLPDGFQSVHSVSTQTGDQTRYYEPYPRSRHGYKLEAGWLHLPLDDQEIWLQYVGDSEPGELPAIPDNPIIQTFLEKKLVYELIHDWQFNGEELNLERKLQQAAQEYEVAYRNAQFAVKLPSPQQVATFFHRQKRRLYR